MPHSEGSGPPRDFRTVSTIGWALVAGVVTFALVALLLNAGAGTWDTTLLDAVFIVGLVSAVGASRFVWQTQVRDGSDVATGLIVSWAILEGVALFGLVLFLVQGSYVGFLGALALVVIALLWYRPRRAWFAG